MKKDDGEILGISLIVCKNPQTGKYLAVHEKNGSWWVPGGRVDAPEAFSDGARRECIEEAGVKVELKGILRIEQSPSANFSRLKIVFYAEPVDPQQAPKSFADAESLGAAYYTLQEIWALRSKWRGPQLYQWSKYVEQGGIIYPLGLLSEPDLSQ